MQLFAKMKLLPFFLLAASFVSIAESSSLLRGAKRDQVGKLTGTDEKHQNERHVKRKMGHNMKKSKTKQKSTSKKTKKHHKLSRVIVRYTTPRGRMLALETASNVFYDFAADNSVIVELDEEAKQYLTNENIDILAVDEDTVLESHDILVDVFAPDKQRYLQQTTPYGITMVQADQIEVTGQFSTRAKVCLIDTGALVSHPDLNNNTYYLAGQDRYSAVEGSYLKWNFDVNGHGTHLAGIVAAKVTNNIGVRGIGAIPLIITRGMNDAGQCMQSDILQAIDQCVAMGAKIVSMSFGGSSISTTFREKLDYLYDTKGMLIFASAGNDGLEKATYPAAYHKVVSVGAANETAQRWKASNTGPWIELMAPGDRILSTCVKNGQPSYALYSGTSMASPHAAGVAAFLWTSFPQCSNKQIRYAMSLTARDIGTSGCDTETGNGIVQAKAAFDFLNVKSCMGTSWVQYDDSTGCSILA